MDITERKNAEEQYRSAAQRLELAATTAALGIWDQDLLSGNITANDRMYEIYRCPREVAPSREVWKQYLHPDDAPHVIELRETALQSETPVESVFRIRRSDGSIGYIQAAVIALRDAANKPIRLLALMMGLPA